MPATAASPTTLSRLMIRSALNTVSTAPPRVIGETAGGWPSSTASSSLSKRIAITTKNSAPANLSHGTNSNQPARVVNSTRKMIAPLVPIITACRTCCAGKPRQARAMTSALSPDRIKSRTNTWKTMLSPCSAPSNNIGDIPERDRHFPLAAAGPVLNCLRKSASGVRTSIGWLSASA